MQKCVESVMALPIDKEIILVDDGSTDRSPMICDQLQVSSFKFQDAESKVSFHSEIKVVHQENKGVSAARNAGLDIATGDYVWFVDADDRVSEELGVRSEELGGFSVRSEELGVRSYILAILGFVWEENGVARRFGSSKDEVPYNLWRCWFDRKTINDIGLRFTVGRKYAEDQEYIWKFLIGSRAKEKDMVLSIVSPIYYYTLRPGSAMTRKGVKMKKIKDISDVLVSFFWNTLCSGLITKTWVWKEMKRMAKTLYVTIIRN